MDSAAPAGRDRQKCRAACAENVEADAAQHLLKSSGNDAKRGPCFAEVQCSPCPEAQAVMLSARRPRHSAAAVDGGQASMQFCARWVLPAEFQRGGCQHAQAVLQRTRRLSKCNQRCRGQHLLKGDPLLRDDGQHPCKKVTSLCRHVGRNREHPLQDLLAQFLQVASQDNSQRNAGDS